MCLPFFTTPETLVKSSEPPYSVSNYGNAYFVAHLSVQSALPSVVLHITISELAI